MLSPSTTIEEGAEVLFFVDKRRRWIRRVRRGGVFGSDRGSIPYENVIGRVFGEAVRLSLGFKAYLLRPLLIDYIEKGFERWTQVIYPKDLGFMLILSGIGPGSRVLEAGVGSGVLTAVLANAVRPDGVVVGYELRREFAEVAMENLRRVGLDRFVEIRVGDIREASLNEEFDAAFLDLPD
ncbi:MAG TPA: methyltransferase domain-containing protein, partial [Candidatus Korarchaeota archaeon]|nr:methyltransferase domain-containing protein [Candidatus Korarchaeota archaeon]